MNSLLPHSDLERMLDIIYALTKCTSVSEFTIIIEKMKSLIPFSFARCGFCDTREFQPRGIAAFEMVSRFPDAWEKRYAQQNYVLTDAIATVASQRKGLIYWSDCLEVVGACVKKNPEPLQIMDEAAEIGLKDGWVYSQEGRRFSERAIISFGGDNCKNDNRALEILEHLGPHLCQAVKKIVLGQNESMPRLTPREKEILSWMAAGKTAWETSQILNISNRTVEFHVRNILKKLDAVNSYQAIATAVSHGLIAL